MTYIGTNKPSGRIKGLAMATAVALSLATVAPQAWANAPDWNPTASERLVKLPSSYLKKAIDRDFAGSPLAGALNNLNQQVALKRQSITDLAEAAEMAEGDVKIELRHQHLAEKQAFIRLMGERQDLQRSQAETRLKLYGKLLRKLERENRGMTPEKQELVARQEDARARFNSVTERVDLELFGEPGVEQSKYSAEYARNYAAIKKLAAAIDSHPMNEKPEIDGEPVSKQEYLRRLIEDSEAELAILDQKEQVLGYMAKLVALDALALAEDVSQEQLGLDSDEQSTDDNLAVANNVDLFIH